MSNFAKKRITLADVATQAGVSKMTASRALRRTGDVSDTSVVSVQKAARDLGYVGNHLAVSLASQRTALIGVVVPSLANIVFAEALSGIADAIEGSGLQPVFGVTDYDTGRECDVIRNMLSWNPTGLIVTGLDQSADTKRLLKDAEIPVVQIMDLDGTPIDACVGFSHRAAGEAMAEALFASGRRQFGYVGAGLTLDTRAQKRHEGFADALSRHGLAFEASREAGALSHLSDGREMTAAIISEHPELDCLYYSNDDLAAGGAFHCIAAGIAVPDRLLLAGFNGLDIVEALPVAVATSVTPRREIGRAAAGIILASKRDAGVVRKVSFRPKIVFDR